MYGLRARTRELTFGAVRDAPRDACDLPFCLREPGSSSFRRAVLAGLGWAGRGAEAMASLTFFVAAGVALVAAVVGVSARRPQTSVAGFGLCLAALVVPVLLLQAPVVAALMLLAAALVIGLSAGIGARTQALLDEGGRSRGLPWGFWIPAGLGLAGFVWVLVATASRQFNDSSAGLDPAFVASGGRRVLSILGAEWLVPTSLVGLLALTAVLASVLTLAHQPQTKT